MFSKFSSSESHLEVLSFKSSLLAMLGIALVSMLIALDQTVVSTALPSIIKDLNGFNNYTWVANSYLLASVAVVPVFGRLGDIFGRKKFVILSVIIFTSSSLLCAVSNDMTTLIIARALQGFGGGMMVGNAFACVPDLFPSSHDRIKWQVVISMAFGTGTALGPTLGGFLAEDFSWRWAFLINLPVGVFSLVMLSIFLPKSRKLPSTLNNKAKVDYLGGILITLLLAASQWFTERATNQGLTLTNASLLLVIVILCIIFYRCEKIAAHPIVPIELLKGVDTLKLLILSIFIGYIMFSVMYFMPLLLQGGFGRTPQEAGIIVTPFALCMALGSMLNTRIIIQLSKPVRILVTGFTFLLICSVSISFLTPDSSNFHLLLILAIGGVGLGFSINNLNVFSQDLVGKNHFGIITALLQSTRMIGGMLGTTLTGTFINIHYSGLVQSKLSGSDYSSLALRIRQQFSDPQLLIDTDKQSKLLEMFTPEMISPHSLIQLGRESLINTLNLAFVSVAFIATIGVIITFSLMHLRLYQSTNSLKKLQ